MALPSVEWPEGKKFAFTIFDDTDNSTVENTKPVYDLLGQIGIRITKSVWPLRSDPDDPTAGESLQDEAYLDFILGLQEAGFEIGYHGARGGDNPRSVTHEALDLFRESLGHDPATYAQHARSIENVYWGERRTAIPLLGKVAARFHQHRRFYGDEPESLYFWGDLCRSRIKYVRNYGFEACNLLASDPWTPYHDPRKPYVNYWFSSSGIRLAAGRLDACLTPTLLDRWERDGGLVILGCHLGQNLVCDGKVNPGFENGLRRLARRDGWYAPVGVVLDYLRSIRGNSILSRSNGLALETRWANCLGRKVVRTGLKSFTITASTGC